MKSELFHIYGPIAINSYGLFIALGVIVLIMLVKRDPRYTKLKLEKTFLDTVAFSIISGLIGGRILFLLSEETTHLSLIQMLAPWSGGFSVLGGIIGILLFLPLFLNYKKIPILPFLDLAAIYAPLTHSISRIGCFFAGCCYGTTSTASWSILYTDQQCFAPLSIHIHPTQLYSSILLLAIFCIMYFVVQRKTWLAGQISCIYLILASIERFVIDFWRGDRIIVMKNAYVTLSHTQLLAIFIAISASITYSFIIYKNIQKNSLKKGASL